MITGSAFSAMIHNYWSTPAAGGHEHPGDRGERTGDRPRQREHGADRDPLGQRRFLVVGDRPHRQAHARVAEEREQHGDQHARW